MNLKKLISRCFIGLIIISVFIAFNLGGFFARDQVQARGPIQKVSKSTFSKIKSSQSSAHIIKLDCNSWITDHDIYLQLGKGFKYPSFPIEGMIYEYNSFMHHMFVLSEISQTKIFLYLENFSKFSKTSEYITKKMLLNEFKSMMKQWNYGGFFGTHKKSIVILYN